MGCRYCESPFFITCLELSHHIQLKGPVFADIETPPNHVLFNKENSRNLGAPSPLLQCRLANQAAATPATAAPVINNNFTIPPEFIAALRPPLAAPVQAPAPIDPGVPALAAAVLMPLAAQLTLLPPGMVPGPCLDIKAFCSHHDLADSVATKLLNNRYRTSAVFYLVQITDLEKMDFLPGEIYELCDAVRQWAVPV